MPCINNPDLKHPCSITRSVAYNLVGPALPQALHFVRYRNAQQYSKSIGKIVGEDEIQKNPVLSSKDITGLVAISTPIQEFDCSQCESESVQGLDSWGSGRLTIIMRVWLLEAFAWRGLRAHRVIPGPFQREPHVLLIVNLLKGNLSKNHVYEGHFSNVVEKTPTEQLISTAKHRLMTPGTKKTGYADNA
ncbi:uncharacterized protein EDB91DRAFT_1335722 [Suillus paluster]|uniref:uncharacterized protein n=1 Tax=Suillus paluster TaxID=48578 RepID=UPI001B86F896|nr:uncharacterized protein EDB91DRAFT_1335722 [Suillus paluster]KAG1744168.1 hypothetical protein EDB91DRAFT_1335722 [Suillus paluster]